jgi:transcriptional regulator with XRE-family HTH domain
VVILDPHAEFVLLQKAQPLQLAKKSGVGITTINRIETGTVEDPHFSTLRKIAQALEVATRPSWSSSCKCTNPCVLPLKPRYILYG